MKNSFIKKTIVFGTIVLFFTVSLVSATNNNVESTNVINDIKKPSRDTKTFYSTADAYIKHNAPDRNRGGDQYFNVRDDYGFGGSSGWGWAGLIKFDVSVIPKGANIISATLNIYYFDHWDINPVNRPIRLYRALNDWDEYVVTWNTQPSYSSQMSASCPVPSNYGWMMWDMIEDIQDFVNGEETNFGWLVTDDNYWGQFDIPISRFRTRENESFTPYLEVEYKKARSFDIINQFFLQFLQNHPNMFPILRHLLRL